MKRIIVFFAAIILTSNFSFAQYKGYDDKGPSSYNKNTSNLLFGFINPKNFTMNHSFNMQMQTTSYGNVSLTSYINSMNYQISDRFNVSADVKFQYSPYASSSLGSASALALQKNLSGVFLSRASMNYRISDNAFINFEYRKLDESDYMNDYYNPFYSNSRNLSNWR